MSASANLDDGLLRYRGGNIGGRYCGTCGVQVAIGFEHLCPDDAWKLIDAGRQYRDLLRRALKVAASREPERPLWAVARDLNLGGRTAAMELCRQLGLDPDVEGDQ